MCVGRGGLAAVSHTCVICLRSWFPCRMVIRSRYRTFSATSRLAVSTEWYLRASRRRRSRAAILPSRSGYKFAILYKPTVRPDGICLVPKDHEEPETLSPPPFACHASCEIAESH